MQTNFLIKYFVRLGWPKILWRMVSMIFFFFFFFKKVTGHTSFHDNVIFMRMFWTPFSLDYTLDCWEHYRVSHGYHLQRELLSLDSLYDFNELVLLISSTIHRYFSSALLLNYSEQYNLSKWMHNLKSTTSTIRFNVLLIILGRFFCKYHDY